MFVPNAVRECCGVAGMLVNFPEIIHRKIVTNLATVSSVFNSSHPVSYLQCLTPVRIEHNLLVCLSVCHLNIFDDFVCGPSIKKLSFPIP